MGAQKSAYPLRLSAACQTCLDHSLPVWTSGLAMEGREAEGLEAGRLQGELAALQAEVRLAAAIASVLRVAKVPLAHRARSRERVRACERLVARRTSLCSVRQA